MAEYLAQRLIDKANGDLTVKFTYSQVIAKYPNLKVAVDAYLVDKGKGDLIA